VIPAKYKRYEDKELVTLCLQGDSVAWEALITRFKRLIYTIPLRFGLSADDAADIFQVICLTMIDHLHKLKDEARLPMWLITTTTRQCIALRDKRAQETGLPEDELDEPADPAENLEEIRLQVEEQQVLRQAIEFLPDRCRELIDRLYLDSQPSTYEELSEELSIPLGSIAPTKARCLDKLRTLLRKRGIK